MYRDGKRVIAYVTGSDEKIEENKVFRDVCSLDDGRRVSEVFEFDFVHRSVLQVLECDIAEMVKAGVKKAYSELKVPCVVEYAGLILEKFKTRSYPGGLTKAMWNALGDHFVRETKASNKRAIARAAVAYCDGKKIHCFTGDTEGRIATTPRGDRHFYWDTIFMPDDPSGKVVNKTYSEIVADKRLGLTYKMRYLSQSTKAMLQLLNHINNSKDMGLWK